jgi:putative addiction module component (TIGR02574 family)
MEPRTRELYEAALGLPESERETLIDLLSLTIDYGDPNEIAAYWREEIERRYQQIVSGEVQGIPWSEVKKRARQAARGKS